MFRPLNQIGLPRRIVAFYLLFCLMAVTLLAGGAAMAVQALLTAQATDGALSRIGRLAAAVQLDFVKTGGTRTQALIEKARSEGRFAHIAIIGLDGRNAAHTNPAQVGAVAVQPSGSALAWGTIDGVRHRDEHDRLVSEYTIDLHAGDKPAGALRVAIIEPGWFGTLLQFGRYATLAVLGPVACIAFGGVWLRRQTQPLAEVEARLAAIAREPHGSAPRLEAVSPRGLASVGWNRLAEHVATLQSADEAFGPEQKLARRARGTADRRTQDALECLAEGIAVTGADGRIEFANRALTALLGAEEDLDGDALAATLEAIAPDCAERINRAARGSTVVAEAAIDASGGGRTLRVERAPVLTADRENAGHVWTIRDVTQHKLVEESRDQFIDTATHELRTPLANIKAYAETLSMCDLQDVEQQKDFCNTINTEATRLARFVDDLLSISSLETGSLGVNRQNVAVRRLLEEAAEKVRPLMNARSIAFDVKLPEKLGEAALDKDKVSGMLVNLLGNAAKYSPEGSSVTFTAVRKEQELQIEVRDTGVGIADEEQEHVFEKFFRSDNPEVRDQIGTGLGLPLAREIARLHRGDLTLKSKLGEGSTFTVTLPVC